MSEGFDQDEGDSTREPRGLRYLLAAVTLGFVVPAVLLAERGSVIQVLLALAAFLLPLIVLRWGVAAFFAVIGLVTVADVLLVGNCIASISEGL